VIVGFGGGMRSMESLLVYNLFYAKVSPRSRYRPQIEIQCTCIFVGKNVVVTVTYVTFYLLWRLTFVA